jgi:Rrf2 family protein
MLMLSQRSLLAIVAVVDVALHARPQPVAAKLIAARHNLPPRHLETILQGLVHAGILRGVRGPRGGYELGRERARISAAQIVRAVMNLADESDSHLKPVSKLADGVVAPIIQRASLAFLDSLDRTSVEELCDKAMAASIGVGPIARSEFTI